MRKILIPLALLLVAGSFGIAQEAEDTYDPADYRRIPLLRLPEGFGGEDDYLDLHFGLGGGFIKQLFYIDGVARMDYNVGPFTLTAELAASNDQKYAPARVMNASGNLGWIYFLLQEGGVVYDWKWLNLQAGRYRLYDIVDSPYSLYINSMGIASNTMQIKVESPRFIYSSRWIELNSRSAVSSPEWDLYHQYAEQGFLGKDPNLPLDSADPTSTFNDNLSPNSIGFPDRGVNYKIYALKYRDWRFGILDATVYTERSFDYEYFLNPLPQYFIQYVKGTPGRPWTTDSNENDLLGFFWDIKKQNRWEAYAQFLMDDFGLGFVAKNFSDNPWKAAWAVGGRVHTPYGRFGFHHGGALKYTFEPITSPQSGRYNGNIARTAYGYTYYPETRYNDDEDDGSAVSILIEDNMVGYKHGENNIAFLVDYQNTFSGFKLNAELEFVLAGNNSPANPWQDYTHRSEMGDGSRLLDDSTLEKRLELRLNLSHRRGPWLFYAAAAIGGRFNRLELQEAVNIAGTKPEEWSTADQIYIWKGTQEHELIFRFSLGFRYTVPVL
ncbi:MAG: hypothetical protein LBJ24_00640 [Treponema sp.]|jgi:hypothetical protein|nr:hypothetical protein [Treponema sp.]